MARKSLDQMLADLLTAFPDQNTKFITPAILRTYFDDLIKALRPSYALLRRDTAVAQAVTVLPIPLVFTVADVTASQGEYTANASVGRITRLDAGTVNFQFAASVSSPSNSPRTLTFSLYKNGVATPFRQSQTFNVIGEVISLSFPAIQFNNGVANYDMYVESSVADTFTFSNMGLVAQTIPVNNYV